MANNDRTPGKNLRANILALMELHGDDTVSLSKKSGIPQRTVYNLVYTEQRASVEQAELLARAYGFTGWQIIMPTLPSSPTQLARVIEGYLEADETDQRVIDALVTRPRR